MKNKSIIAKIWNKKIDIKIRKFFGNLSFNKSSKMIKPLNFSIDHSDDSMQSAGVIFKEKKYTTHSTLHHSESAIESFSIKQKLVIFFLLFLLMQGIFLNFLLTLQILISVLSFIYLIDLIFNAFIVVKSLHSPKEITFNKKELDEIDEKSLPVYSILCPLYKELSILPQFIEAMSNLDYPKNKLQIILLLEEDDTETIKKIKELLVPRYFEGAIVPLAMPKTKPKACNYGLSYAKGEYLVIYDAEDIPDPLQLKKAILAFRKVDENVICLQAKLNYYNPNQNLLTRLFTAEYSLWFDIILPGLQSLNSFIPLGGTSNHFKTSKLKELEGWDAFNVTEDADLGIRLFKKGYKTAIIDSVTLEEANSEVLNWIQQRSRWIKGYMQTYLVHTRDLFKFTDTKPIHQFIFHLVVGGKIAFALINPILWIATIAYFVLTPIVGAAIQTLYPAPVLYLALPSLVLGNFLFLFYYMLGLARRQQWWLIKYIAFIPVYWVMISTSAAIALFQLFFKPHFWAKTVHGLHIDKAIPRQTLFARILAILRNFPLPQRLPAWPQIAYLSIFLTLDIILASLTLSPADTKIYILISLLIKCMTIAAQCLAYFFNRHKFYNLIFSSFLFQWIVFVVFGIEGHITIPFLFKETLNTTIPYIAFYSFAWMCFAAGNIFVYHHFKQKNYVFSIVSAFIALLQIIIFLLYAGNIKGIFIGIAYLGTINLITMIFLHINPEFTKIIENNINSFLSIFKKTNIGKTWQEKKLRILIFNWRDTKHKYAGGAEIYLHELAKRWVKDGNQVTIFCGNDNKSSVNEKVDGIQIIRRGGTYTVYVFALLYYLIKLRGKYDIIIDSENGIPFFTPLYTRVPKFLLIHHVHQEVFKKHLILPLAVFAKILESKLMPIAYSNTQIITVSKSSKQEIIKLGLGKKKDIKIIHPGIDDNEFFKMEKTTYPSFLYLGRLQPYKNIDIAIKAFAKVHKEFPNSIFTIAGSGNSMKNLKSIATKLNLDKYIIFKGKVSDSEKKTLLAKSWVAIQPSMMEGFGITVIEANACGTPVIASNVHGLRDSVVDKKTGILVKLKDIDSLEKAMLSCIVDNDLRKYLSNNAYYWARTFSWNKNADQFYLEIIKQLSDNSILNKDVYVQFAKSINV